MFVTELSERYYERFWASWMEFIDAMVAEWNLSLAPRPSSSARIMLGVGAVAPLDLDLNVLRRNQHSVIGWLVGGTVKSSQRDRTCLQPQRLLCPYFLQYCVLTCLRSACHWDLVARFPSLTCINTQTRNSEEVE